MIFHELYPHPHKPGVRVCKQTLDRILNGNQSKSEPLLIAKEARDNELVEIPKPEISVEQAITPEQQAAMDAIKKMRAGVPFTRSFEPAPQVETEPIKTMTFGQEILHTWRSDPDVRAEFISLSSYQAYMKAQRAGRTKIHRGTVIR